MIEEIDVRDLGVVARATVRPAPGLTAITGETGTGKTMVLTSLGLLLGRRADPALVRTGAAKALVEGTVLLDPRSPEVAVALDAGAILDEDALIVSRTLPAEGRSKAHLGGRAVPSSLLGEVLGASITVHGQSDQLRLRSPDHQRAALDIAGGPQHGIALTAYAAAWEELRVARARARSFRDDAIARRVEIASLTDLLGRWDAAAPAPGEDLALRDEAGRLGNVEELREAAARAHAALTAEDGTGAGALVEGARAALERAGGIDRELASLATRLAEVGYLLTDAAGDLASYLDGLEGDPDRLAQVHTRIAQLTELTRGHEDLAAMAQEVDDARRRLDELTGPGADQEAVQRALDDAARRVREAGAAVTAGRERTAAELSTAIDAELAGLAMAGAHLSVRLTPRDRPGPHGLEDVDFLLTPHPGAPARPLGQGASGGELSRLMLALEVVLARSQAEARGPASAATDATDTTGGDSRARRPPLAGRPTMVFDEIDAGIGGRTAQEIGRRLARLAEHVQVIVVTHLAQVAAFADTHLVVTKRTDDTGAVTRVDELTGEDRIGELARMLSGHDTEAARRHAAELAARSRVGG